jgi:hypothetical protein
MKIQEMRTFGGSAAGYLFPDREALRKELLATRPIIGADQRIHCELWAYETEMKIAFPHVCGLGWNINEVLYMRNDFPPELQWYILLSELNCSLVCGAAHNKIGHTLGFRSWFWKLEIKRYGERVIKDYLLLGPNKVKTSGF